MGKRENLINYFAITKYTWMQIIKYKLGMILLVGTVFNLAGQVPDWVDPVGEYSNTMRGTFVMSDECVPSADAADIVAVFDLAGNIRGVHTTDNDNRAFVTIRGDGGAETLYFKVYDAGTDKVYNIYNTSITFAINGSIASPSNPMILNFDSSPMGVAAGPDQEVFNMTTTTLEAVGVGNWSVVEGVGGSFVDPTDPTTVFNGIIATKYILAWTLDNAAGCIGETDEVIIYFVLNEPENGNRTCNDGLDNDGDGLYDCEDPDCGQPVVIDITTIEPTPIDCNSTMADGSFTIVHMNADSFSLDMGLTKQESNLFSNKEAGAYDVLLENSTTGCKTTETAILENTMDALSGITSFKVMGPEILCMGLQDVNYTLDKPSVGVLSWVYTGSDASVTPVGEIGMADFGMNATAGGIVATMTSTCSSLSDTLEVSFANMFLCSFSNCPAMVNITTGVLESANAPQVYRAGMTLQSTAEIKNFNYEFTAGESLNFDPGFSIEQGLSFMAAIKSCTN